MSMVLVEKRGNIGIITMNNPKSLNALNTPFINAMLDAMEEIHQDPSIFVLIITGSEKAFIAGADIKQMYDIGPVEMLEWTKGAYNLNAKAENMRIPVIAAINGFALGGGCEFAISCDIRYASTKARLGLPEVSLGIIPGGGGTQRLPRLIGEGKAKELIYSARMIDAEEAYRIGLVQKVVEPEALMDECIKLANEILQNGQIAVQQCKKSVNHGMQADIETGLAIEAQAFALCNATEDKKVGMGAFINKEKEKKWVYK